MEINRKNVLDAINQKDEVKYSELWDIFELSLTPTQGIEKQVQLINLLRKLLRDREIINPVTKRKNKDGTFEEGTMLMDLDKYIITEKGQLALKNPYWEWVKSPDNLFGKILIPLISFGVGYLIAYLVNHPIK